MAFELEPRCRPIEIPGLGPNSSGEVNRGNTARKSFVKTCALNVVNTVHKSCVNHCALSMMVGEIVPFRQTWRFVLFSGTVTQTRRVRVQSLSLFEQR